MGLKKHICWTLTHSKKHLIYFLKQILPQHVLLLRGEIIIGVEYPLGTLADLA